LDAITVSLIVHDDFSHVRRALRSLMDQPLRGLRVVVTVNAGRPEDVSALQAGFPDVVVRVNPTPRGFAANHNAVLREADTLFVALVNDDIRAQSGMLDDLADFLVSHPQVGLVSPRVLNPDGSPQLMAFNDPTVLRMLYKISGLGYFTRQGTPLRRLAVRLGGARLAVASFSAYEHSAIVPVVVGVAMLVRREAYLQAGVMDEDTRVYGEESAWCWRLRQCGWQIALVAETSVTHYNSEQPLKGWKLAEHRKGILNYYVRYRPEWQALIIRAALIGLHSLRALGASLFDRGQAAAELRVVRMALCFRPLPPVTPG
jgi:GT2 family glycosyltransferase